MSVLSLHVLLRRVFLHGKRFHHGLPSLDPVAPPSSVREVIDAFSTRYSNAEVLASRFGNLYRSAYWAIYLLSSLAVGMALLTMALPDLGAWFVAIETLTIILILAIFIMGSRQNWHLQWLEFRKEAEVIRYLPLVHIASQLSLSSSKDINHNLQSDQEISREVFYEVPIVVSTQEKELLKKLDRLIKDGNEVDPDFVRWVLFIMREQIQYHKKRAYEEHIIHERIHKLAFFCFVVTALAVMAHSGLHSIWLSVIAAFFPSLAAALTGVAAHAEMVRLKLESDVLVRDLSEIERLLSDPLAGNETVKECLKRFVEKVLGEVIVWHTFTQHKALTLA